MTASHFRILLGTFAMLLRHAAAHGTPLPALSPPRYHIQDNFLARIIRREVSPPSSAPSIMAGMY